MGIVLAMEFGRAVGIVREIAPTPVPVTLTAPEMELGPTWAIDRETGRDLTADRRRSPDEIQTVDPETLAAAQIARSVPSSVAIGLEITVREIVVREITAPETVAPGIIALARIIAPADLLSAIIPDRITSQTGIAIPGGTINTGIMPAGDGMADVMETAITTLM